MELSEYLIARGISPAQFAKLVGAGSRMTIHRYLKGARKPCRSMMSRIENVTRGLVTAADFEKPPEGGERRDEAGVRELPWTRSELNEAAEIEAAYRRMMAEPLPGTGPSPPLRMALFILGERVREKDGRFYLDRRPSGIPMLIRAANRILIAEGELPIRYPGVSAPGEAGPAGGH